MAGESILVVEDVPMLNRLARLILGEAGFKVQVVASIAEARIALLASPFDGVVADLTLPNGDGLDVVRAIRVIEPHLCLVVWSADDSLNMAHEAMLLYGVDDVVVKDGTPSNLPRVLRLALERRESMMPDADDPNLTMTERRSGKIKTAVTQRLAAINVPPEKSEKKIADAAKWWTRALICACVALVFLSGASYVVYLERANITLLLLIALAVPVGLPVLAILFCVNQADGEATKAFLAEAKDLIPFLRPKTAP